MVFENFQISSQHGIPTKQRPSGDTAGVQAVVGSAPRSCADEIHVTIENGRYSTDSAVVLISCRAERITRPLHGPGRFISSATSHTNPAPAVSSSGPQRFVRADGTSPHRITSCALVLSSTAHISRPTRPLQEELALTALSFDRSPTPLHVYLRMKWVVTRDSKGPGAACLLSAGE